MAKVRGLTRRQLLERHYQQASHDLNVYMEKHRQNVDRLIKNENEQGRSYLWTAAAILPGAARGLIQGSIDIISTYRAISAQLSNDISYLFDPDREEEWQEDVKYLFANLGATAIEGVSAAAFGMASDVGHLLFGADTAWADDPIEGVIANFSRVGNQLRANALDPDAGAFDGISEVNRGFWAGMNERFLGKDRRELYSNLEARDMANQAKIGQRWQTEAPRAIGEGMSPSQQEEMKSYFQEQIPDIYSREREASLDLDPKSEEYRNYFKTKYGKDLGEIEESDFEFKPWTQEELEEDRQRFIAEQYRYELFEDLVDDMEKHQGWKKNIDKWTGKEFFDERAGNNPVYKYTDQVAFSLGRLIPSFIMTKYAGGTGATAQVMKKSSRAYFAASVAGGAMEQALSDGASVEDAWSYALGSASNELFWAQMGGIRLGDAASLAAPSIGKVARKMLVEAVEEMFIETGYRGLEFYSNEDNVISTGESRSELWERVFYSGMVGGLSGGFMGGLSYTRNLSTQSQIDTLNRGLQASVNAKGAEATTREINMVMNRLESRLNSDSFLNKNAKAEIMADPIVSQLFNETQSGTYEVSDIGQRLRDGNFQATQGGETITSQTHAVSHENFFQELLTNVDVVNPQTNRMNKKNIKVVTRDQIQNVKHSKLVNEALNSGMNVAFVEVQGRNAQATPDGFDAFFDPNTGVTYVNINSEVGVENLLAHEVHDTLSNMARTGQMTKQGRQAYLDFLDTYAGETSNQMFQDLGVTFNESAYAQAYKGRQDFASLMETERVSAFLQQAMNNSRIIENGLRKNPSMFKNIAQMFTRKSYYNKMLKEMGIDTKAHPNLARSLSKLERSFTRAIKANQQNVRRADSFIQGVFGQKAADTMFSIQVPENQVKQKAQLFNNFFNNQNGANGMPGLDIQAFLQPENLASFFDFYSNQTTTYEVLSQENNARLHDQGYFVQINDATFYHQDAFKVHKDMFISDMEFNANSHYFTVELSSKTNPNAEPIYRRLVPHAQVNGRMIENASMFEASVDLHTLQYMAHHGKSPAQSFAIGSVAGNAFFTNNFGPVTMLLNQNITQEKDFNMFRQDIWSGYRRMEINRKHIDFVDSEGDAIRGMKDLSIGAKMNMFKKILDHTKYVAGENQVYDSLEMIENQTTDRSKVGFQKLLGDLEVMRMDYTNPRQTLNELKSEINIGQDLAAQNLLDLYDQAVNSLETVVQEVGDLKTIFMFLNHADMMNQGKRAPYIERLDEFSRETAQENYHHFETINRFLNTIPYQLNNAGFTSEGKMEIRPEMAPTIVLNTSWKNPNQNHRNLTSKELADIRNTLDTLNQQLLDKGLQGFQVVEINEGHYRGKPKMLRENILNSDVGNNIVFSMNNNKSKTLDNKSTEKIQEATNENETVSQTREQTTQDVVNQQDFNDRNERIETEQTITQNTQNKFSQQVTQLSNKNVTKNINRFKQAQSISKTVNKVNYQNFENTFADNIDAKVQQRLKKPVTKLDKTAAAIYNSLQNVIQKQKTNREFYNHMASHVTKTAVNELTTLSELIRNDTKRMQKTPTDTELEYIVRQVNKSIFQTLDYIDSDVTLEINQTAENPQGYAFTRAMYWYLRDMKAQQTWNAEDIQRFNEDGRGFAYRRLINAILNFNKKNGARELHNALNHFSKATRVENVSDLALDGDAPRTIDNAKAQWERNTNNINTINETIGYNPRVSSWFDTFTIGETHGHFNPNSWGMVLNEKLVQATDKKLQIDRAFREHFEANGFLKNNYRNVVQMDNAKNAITIKNLGNIKVNQSQVIYLRNMLLREISRNRAIDLGIIRGEKSNHFNAGNKVDILGKSFMKDRRIDNKTTGTISDPIALLNELDTAISQNNFMTQFNQKALDFFNKMYPYVNERYKELHGMNLQNDGQLISERLQGADASLSQQLLDGMPSSVTMETIANTYVPFLLDNSGYFKQNKIDFTKGIIDMGVFDGMTQEISDSNAIVTVESITDVVSSYAREVANYYGLHRVMNDFNRILNERLDSYQQTTYVGRNIPKQVVTFYENLLNDMAGYKPRATNPKLNRTLAHFRRNFYRAALGANARVIASQVTTMFNLSNIYGSHFTEMFPKMMTNFFAQHTKQNKQKIQYLEDNNNVYWDRKRSASFEVGEATTEGVFGNNALNRSMQTLMKGIKFTDGSINRALYLTLLDTINPETGKKFTEAEASREVQMAILRSQSSVLAIAKSPLLRTHNELFRVMLRFLGEPMKLITQSYNSASQISYLKKLEQNQSQIVDTFNQQVNEAQQALEQAQNELQQLEAQENSDSFNNLDEAQQREIHNKVNEARRVVDEAQQRVDEVTNNRDTVVQEVQRQIAEKPKAHRLAKKRFTAFAVATMYLTLMRSGFDLVRSKGGAKDRPDDQEYMEYLANLIGRNFGDSLVGSFPFYREAYQTISSGYSSVEIGEFTAFNDLLRSFNYLTTAVVNGNDIHMGRTIRSVAMASGRLMGVPTYQLERLFTTPTLYVNESLHYRYHSATGRQTRDNIELKRAIERGDTKMIEAIVDRRIMARGITVSNPVSNELVRLYGKGHEVNMSGVNRSFTVDGETFEMTRAQRQEFAKVYNQADHIISKLIRSPRYRRLNDDARRSIINSVYTYFYNLAKEKISGKDIIPERSSFRTLNQIYRYFLERADRLI